MESSDVCATELRRGRRYCFSAPVQFMWASSNGEPQSGEGVTRNVNTFGAYIVTDVLPLIGAFIQMEILLPGIFKASSGMRLRGEGVVLRTETFGAKRPAGFALQVQFYPAAMESVVAQLTPCGPVM